MYLTIHILDYSLIISNGFSLSQLCGYEKSILMRKKVKQVVSLFFPDSHKIAVKVSLSSFFVAYLLTARLYNTIYENQLKISELFSGTSVFKNYYKPGDFMLPRFFLLAFVICFFLFSLSFNVVREKKALHKPVMIFTLMSGAVLGFKKYLGVSTEEELGILLAVFPLWAVNYFGYSSMSEEEKARADKNMDWSVTAQIVMYFAIRLAAQILLVFGAVSETAVEDRLPFVIATAYITGALLTFGKRKKQGWAVKAAKGFTLLPQLLLCLFPLAFWQFSVVYHEELESFSYRKLQIICILTVLALAIYLIVRIFKKRRNFYPLTFIIIGAMQLPYQYSANSFEPINLFHNGELIVPMQQLSRFYELPFLQFFPIHGMCDYYFQFCNQLFLDGKYTSFDMGYYLGSILLCCIAAYIYYKCIPKSSLAMVFIVFFSVIGEWYYYFRFIFVLPIMLLLFHKSVYKDFFKTVKVYIVSSILAIAWYPAIGGTLAVALLPVIVSRGFRQKEYFTKLKERKFRIGQYKAGIPVLVMGICFIPFFVGILRYLKENMGISQYFPGDMLRNVVDTSVVWRLFWIENFWNDPALFCFSFVLPLLILTVWAFSKKGNVRGIEAAGIGFVFFYLICSYTFGTIFAGERSLITTVVFLAFSGSLILEEDWEKSLTLGICCLVLAASMNTFQVADSQEAHLSYCRIPDDYIQADGEEIGYERMGKGYMKSEEKATLENISFVVNSLCSPDDTYVDFTNQSALYCMLDKKTPFSYTCLYHGTSEETQKKMLEEIKRDPPKVVLVSPCWENEGGSAALKNKEIYQYFMENGYQPYLYENVCFLLSDDIPRPEWASEGMEEFCRSISVSELQGLPLAWGNADLDKEFRPLAGFYEPVDSHSIQMEGGRYRISGGDPYVVFRVDGEETLYAEGEYLKLHFECPYLTGLDDKDTNMTIYFSSENGKYSEKNSIHFKAANGDMLVPLYAYPIWSEYHFNYLRFDVEDERLLNAEFNISYEFAAMEEED